MLSASVSAVAEILGIAAMLRISHFARWRSPDFLSRCVVIAMLEHWLFT